MNRSVRSGIAIAGMAGGFWLLGQAVAQAADPPTNAADATAVSSTNTSGGSGGSAESENSQKVTAKNEVDNTATSGNIDASGGKSVVLVVAGNGNSVDASSDKGAVDAKQNVTTVVWINSQANGGNVSGSNNASAGDGASNSADASGTLNSNTTGGSGGKDASKAESDNSQKVTAKNEIDNTATSGNIDASGGLSVVVVLAGNENHVDATNGHDMPVWTPLSQDNKGKDGNNRNEHKSGNVDASQTVNTAVTISSEANGGNVSGSNNASAGNGGNNSANASGVLNSNTTGGTGQNGKDRWERQKDGENKGGNAESDNHQKVDATNEVDNTATTGNIDTSGGKSIVGVVAGNGNTLYCTSATGNVTCSQNITTIINIVSQANGGNVSCSNNASAGSAGSAVCPVSNNTNNSEKPAAAAAPVKAAAPVANKASVSASAQPNGTLAFTGAETSLPLTVGLLALGAGGALTLAGRRRSATAAV